MEQERRDRQEREGVHETGRLGGSASMAAGTTMAGERAVAAYGLRDMVRWGPIWAGLLTALGIQIVLSAIGFAIAVTAYDPASPVYAQRVAGLLGIWSAVSTLVALFVGGYIAGRMGAVLGLSNGLIQGTVVWALVLLLSLLLSGIGLAGFLGGVLNLNQYIAGVSPNVSPEVARATADATATGAWWFVVGAILAWAAAAGGAVLGTSRHEEAIEDVT